MGRRISDSDPNGKKPCSFCRTMRVVVLFVVLMVVLMAYADKLYWLEDIPFTNLFGYLVVASFMVVFVYRYWDEYHQPKQDRSARDARRVEREKQFDELDALEAERSIDAAAEVQAEAEVVTDKELEEEHQLNVEVQAEADDEALVSAEALAETEVAIEPEQLDLLGFSVDSGSQTLNRRNT